MSAPHIRVDYDALHRIAHLFNKNARDVHGMLGVLNGCMDDLQRGEWIGVGARKFYDEMEWKVFPAVDRLSTALAQSARVINEIIIVMQDADAEASRLLRTDLELVLIIGAGVGLPGVAAAVAASAGAGQAAAAEAATGSVFSGISSEADAPKSILLPKQLDSGMKNAWKDSFPGGNGAEQGGILVQTKDGSYKWIRGKTGTHEDWAPNFGDIGKDKLVGTGHTHPYNSGHTDVPFSSGDIEFFFRSDLEGKTSERMMMVQSGDGQFVLARTKEFNKLVSGKSETEINNLKTEMTKTYNDTVTAGKKKGLSFAARHDAAVKAVADKYNLLYYKGKNGNLSLQ